MAMTKTLSWMLTLKRQLKLEPYNLTLNFDGQEFSYLSTFTLNKERLGGDESDHVITVKEVNSSKVRVLIYSPPIKPFQLEREIY